MFSFKMGKSGEAATAVAGEPARRSPRTTELPMAFTLREVAGGAVGACGRFLLMFVPAVWVSIILTSAFSPPGEPWSVYGVHGLGQGLVMALLGTPIILIAEVIVGVPAVAAGLLISLPLAYLIMWALRRTTRPRVHACTFAVLGFIIGAAATGTALRLCFPTSFPGPAATALAILPLAAATAFAVMLGWRSTSRRALKLDLEAPETTAAEPQPLSEGGDNAAL